MPEIFVLGHRCTLEGQLPDESRVSAIQKWVPSLSEVHTFLGTVGVVWIFIKNFSLHAHPLIKLAQRTNPSSSVQSKSECKKILKLHY
jgi:hypothetical protein